MQFSAGDLGNIFNALHDHRTALSDGKSEKVEDSEAGQRLQEVNALIVRLSDHFRDNDIAHKEP